MPQKKNSESAKLNAVKRELTITVRVLENELTVVSDCNKQDTSEQSLVLEQSLRTTIEYLKDLREDMSYDK